MPTSSSKQIAAKLLIALALCAPAVLAASAEQVYRRRPPAGPPAYVDRAPGWEIRALTARAQNEPGVTEELSPGSKQTATGGPSGGVPGFSGR